MRTIVLIFALGAVGCLDEQRYITPEAGGPWAFAIDMDTPAYFASEDGDLYLVEQQIIPDFRQPTQDELNELGNIGDLQIPYGQLPWLRRGDIELQIDWTVSNISPMDSGPVEVAVVVNGINEFHTYNPGVQVVDDELVVDFSQWERLFELGPGERRSGTIREEELDEVAVDLATVVNGAPNSHQIVYFTNQAGIDPRSTMYIPDVVPALVGVRLGIRAEAGAGEAPPQILMEATLRVRDVRGVLYHGDTPEPWVPPAPALFAPVVAMEMP